MLHNHVITKVHGKSTIVYEEHETLMASFWGKNKQFGKNNIDLYDIIYITK